MKPVLQSRWKINGKYLIYYGLRKHPYTFKNKIRISRRTAAFINSLDGKKESNEYTDKISITIKKLIKQKIIVDISEKRTCPNSLREATYCKRCSANDYIIPGLEIDSEGLCPICKSFSSIKKLINPLPVMNVIPATPKAKFDVALFYTGGKDSSYLLYYLSKILRLRVLALTWKQPYMSDNALKSIENAKVYLPEVTFIMREAPPESLKKIYKKIYELQDNTCICPSIAYILFFPLLLENSIPYLVLGNEPAQGKALIYNSLAPKIIYYNWVKKAMRFIINIGRLSLMRKPFSKGQLEMYFTVKNLAFGKSRFLKILGYENEIADNLYSSLSEAKEMFIPFKQSVLKSKKRGNIPALVHIDFDSLSKTGSYNWKNTQKILENELGWIDTEKTGKKLHTSCKIEKCKEYSQLQRFREMKSRIIPFSSLELSLAVLLGSISRDQALEEIKNYCGFLDYPKKENEIMTQFFSNKSGNLTYSSHSL